MNQNSIFIFKVYYFISHISDVYIYIYNLYITYTEPDGKYINHLYAVYNVH